MHINPPYIFKISVGAAKRNQARREIVMDERIRCFMRMIQNGETNDKIALYTSLSLETVEELRKAHNEFMAAEPAQKSKLFQHHGLSFQPRKPNGLFRIKTATRFMLKSHPPHSYE